MRAPRPSLARGNPGRRPRRATGAEGGRPGGIAGAGLDVYDTEPLPQNHPLRDLDNAVLTGHTGYVMRENYVTGYRGVVEDVSAWLNGEPVRLLN